MFRTLVYFDDKKVAEYKSLIKGEKLVSFKNVKVSNEKAGKVDISILSGGVSGSSDMDSLDDFENEDVTVIAKIIFKRDITDEPVVVYDVMKDLFSMSRAIRRQIPNDQMEGINNISINENFITLEVLAVYQ